MKKIRKILSIILVALIVLVAVVLFALPRVARSYIVNNSKEILGRKVEVEKIRINYATLTLKIDDFVLYEANDTDVFVSFDKFRINLQLIPTLKQNYTIASLLLDNFEVNVEYDGEHYNFDDMIVEPDSTIVEEEPVDTMPTPELTFSLNNVVIRGGDISYDDKAQGVHHELSKFGFSVPQLYWNSNEESAAALHFKFEPQGELSLKADMDYASKRYRLTFKIINLALAQFSPYLKPYMDSEGMDGVLNTTFYINGSIDNSEDMVLSGESELSDFILKDAKGDSIFKEKLFGIYLDSIDVANNYYGVRKLLISSPQVFAALYDSTTNFEQVFAPVMAMAEDSVTDENHAGEPDSISEDLVYLQVDTVQLANGEIYVTDHSLNRLFRYGVTDINTMVTDVNPNSDSVPVDYSLIFNRAGKLSGNANFSMVTPGVFEYDGDLSGLDLTSFSPYTEYFVGRPITSGNMAFKGNSELTETVFEADNHISINDIIMGEKTDDDAVVNLPIGLALGILKDKNGDVIVDIPMSGDPADPDFSVGKIVIKTLTNFVLKVASAPFNIVADIDGVDPERMQELPLRFARFELSDDNKERLDEIAIALKEKPELMFRFTLEVPLELAQNKFAIYHVKRDYLLESNGKGAYKEKADLEKAIDRLKDKDEEFQTYVGQHTSVVADSTLAVRCINIVGLENVRQGIMTLVGKRHEVLKEYLFETLKVDKNSIAIQDADIFNQRLEVEKPRYRVEVSVK